MWNDNKRPQKTYPILSKKRMWIDLPGIVYIVTFGPMYARESYDCPTSPATKAANFHQFGHTCGTFHFR